MAAIKEIASAARSNNRGHGPLLHAPTHGSNRTALNLTKTCFHAPEATCRETGCRL